MERTGNPSALLPALVAMTFLAACGGGGGGGSPPAAERPPPDPVPPAVAEPPATGTPAADPDPPPGPMTEPPSPDRLLDPGEVSRLLDLLDAGPPRPVPEAGKRRRAGQERAGWTGAWTGPASPGWSRGELGDWAVEHWNGSDPRVDRHGVLSKGGVTLSGNRSGENRALWIDLDHADAFVFATPARGGGVHVEARGVPSGGAPSPGAAWRGLMIGADHATGALLAGDAAVDFDFGAMAVDAAFTGIVDIDRMAPHGVPSVTFRDIPVDGDGGWAHAAGPAVEITVDFMGPGHGEAVGWFQASGMTASFGAVRTDE